MTTLIFKMDELSTFIKGQMYYVKMHTKQVDNNKDRFVFNKKIKIIIELFVCSIDLVK